MKERGKYHTSSEVVDHSPHYRKVRVAIPEGIFFEKVVPEQDAHSAENIREITLPTEVLSRIEAQKKKEVRIYWPVSDSPLLQPVGTPRHEDPSFDSSMESVIPGRQNLKNYIERKFSDRAGDVLALELGGPGSALFSGFTEGFIAESRGVTLVDNRVALAIDPEDDATRDHDVIAGSFFEAKTKREVIKWLDGRKLDFILERMRAGLRLLPEDPRYLLYDVAFWYRQLAPGGLLMAEVPHAFEAHIYAWAEEAKKADLDVRVGEIGHYERQNKNPVYVVRIAKGENAPEEFPFLSKSE